MALKINQSVLNEALAREEAGDVAGAWAVLSAAGDLYAANARDIIDEINNPISIFAKIVQVHWDRVAPGARQTVFSGVGLQHLTQYLDYIRDAPNGTDNGEQLYSLPNTEQIEASYRLAVKQHGLPALTAVDSLFSVMDWNLERSSEPQYVLARMAGAEDITWAQMLEPELETGRLVYDSRVFLRDNIEPYKETFQTMTALLLRANEQGDASFVLAAVQLFNMLIGTLGDVLPQMLGMEEPQAIALTAGLMLSIDDGMTESRMMRILDSLSLGDSNGAMGDIRDLEWLTRNIHQALLGTDPGPFGNNKEALFATATNLIASLTGNNAQNYELTELLDLSTEALVNVAEQETVLGRAYRYALVNLQPFAILQTTGEQTAPDAMNEDYNLDQFTQQYLEDRALFLGKLNTFYLTDASVNADRIIEFQDVETNQLIMTQCAGDHISQRYYFGDEEANNYTGGGDDDHLYGGDGNDTLSGVAGDDYLEGNEGTDTLSGGVGDDALYGQEGEDVIRGGNDRDLLVGGVGQDHLYGGSENDNLYGDNRYFDEELNRYVLVDDKESDRLEGDAGDDLYYAGAGDIKVWVSYSSVMRRQQDL
jgi:hypothetical protein